MIIVTKLGREMRRENAVACASLRAGGEAIQPHGTAWIASSLALLAMTEGARQQTKQTET
jgi:hypothetical protein